MSVANVAAIRHLDECAAPCKHSAGTGIPCRPCLRKRLEYRAERDTPRYRERNARGSFAYYWRNREGEQARKRTTAWWDAAARRARRAGRDVERVCRWDIYDKTDGRCHICGRRIDVEEPDPNSPLYMTVDHVDPHANGGGLVWENLMPAHRFCNTRRGARELTHEVAQEIVTAFVEAFPEVW